MVKKELTEKHLLYILIIATILGALWGIYEGLQPDYAKDAPINDRIYKP